MEEEKDNQNLNHDEGKELGITVKKSENFSEWFSQVCSERGAKLADLRYNVQGFIVHRPWAMRILRKIYEMLEEDVETTGHEPMLFPAVIPESNLMKEKEHAGFAPDVFWITHAGGAKLEERVALRPTGETQIYPMYSLWIRSYNDLPFKGYQSRITVFRNEKTTRPFLRGREFMFFESHDVFREHEEALAQIREDMKTMENVVKKRLKIPFIFFRRPQWDKFMGADDTYASDSLLPDGRRNQISSTHDLGQRFARAYNVVFKDSDGREKLCWQTCFGPGIWRIMAAVIAIHGDDKGLVLPFEVAPVQAVIVPITFSRSKKENRDVLKHSLMVKDLLSGEGIRARVDVSDKTPGFKFNEWELLGVPIRIEIGPREAEKKTATIVRRIDSHKEAAGLKGLSSMIRKEADALDRELWKHAEGFFNRAIASAGSMDEAERIMASHKGFIKVPFCSTGMQGQGCAETLKEKTTYDVCGTPFRSPEKPKGKCIICGEPAGEIVYIAKSI